MVKRAAVILALLTEKAMAQAVANPPAPMPARAGDISLQSLVLHAHPIVQGVIALLAFAAFAVLTILIYKAAQFAAARFRLSGSMAALKAGNLQKLPRTCPLGQSALVLTAELENLGTPLTRDLRQSTLERAEIALSQIEADAMMRLRSATGILATIGAVGPFVGLFGTVFGIMNAFLAIGQTKSTSLAVVAPGIAEALLATGIGLAAAIPAVLLFNAISRASLAHRHRLRREVSALRMQFSRDLDHRMGRT